MKLFASMWPLTCLHGLVAMGSMAFAVAQPAVSHRMTPDELEAVLDDRGPGKVAWKGDLPEMQQRRVIRVLVPHNRTFFFYDGLQPRGLAYEFMTEFASKLNAGKSANARTHMRILKYWVAYRLALDADDDAQQAAASDKE